MNSISNKSVRSILAPVVLLLVLMLGTTTVFGAVFTVVQPGSMHGWSFALDSAFTSVEGDLMTGPDTPPGSSLGSARLAVIDASGDGQVVLQAAHYQSVALSEISTISYATYVASASAVAPSFQMAVDYDTTDAVTGGQGRLIFDPVSVTTGVWQTQDALAGAWRSDTKTPTELCGQTDSCTWAQVLTTWPNAALLTGSDGKVMFKAGGGAAWANFEGFVDAFTFNSTSISSGYDFEPPAVVYVDDSWAAVPLWQDPDLDGPATAMGLDAFTTIQPAVDVVQSDGTIYVAAGTYENTGQIIIHKSVSVIGASRTETILKPLSNLTAGGDAGAWVLVNDGVTFNLSRATLDGDGREIRQGIRFNGSGEIDDILIQHIKAPGYMGFAIVQGWENTTPRTLTVSNSSILDFGRVGIQADSGSGATTTTITNNIITGKGTGDHLDYGITVEGGASAIISGNTISNCYGVASVDGSTSAAVSASTYFAGGTQASITGNNLHHNTYGIAVGYDDTDTSSVTAAFNRIVDNTVGIASTAPTVSAENNWWGCNSGPDDAPPCDSIEGDVDADPWLTLTASSLPSPFYPGSVFTFSASTITNSNGQDTSSLGTLPDGLEILFTPVEQVNPDSANLDDGAASTSATMPLVAATFDLCADLDGQTACQSVVITQPTTTWADDGWVGKPNGEVVNWGAGDHVVGYDAFAAVQPAVNAVSAGGNVNVFPGTYTERVSAAKSLTLTGLSGATVTIIRAPASLPPASDAASNIVQISGAGTSVEMSGLTISGPGPSASGSIGAGIFVRDGATANIHHNRINDIRDSALSSAQSGVAIQVGSRTFTTTGSATIDNNILSGYQKTGISVSQAGSSATISANTITGVGPTNVIAQSGVQITYSATAQINNNTISNHSFTPSPSAIGILIYAADAHTSGNTLTNNFYGIYHNYGSGTHNANTLSATATGTGSTSYYGVAISNVVPATSQPVPVGDAPNALPLMFTDPALAFPVVTVEVPMMVTVSNNDINGNTNGYAGVSVFGGNTPSTRNIELTVNNNILRSWQQALVSRCFADCTTSGYPTVVAEYNSITSSGTYAAANYTAPAVDARYNWWGQVTGPNHSTNPGGTGGVVTNGINFNPWLCSGTDLSTNIGFQPDTLNRCGLPAKLAFTTQPLGGLLNQVFPTQPVVVALDANDKLAPSFIGSVTISIGSNPSGGTLSGTLTKTAVSSTATFTDLKLDRAGADYTLVASATGLTSATSTDFSISNVLPTLTSISPTFVRVGADSVVITLTGTDFAYNAEAHWNGTPLTVTERSGTMLKITVPGTLLTGVGQVDITAFNPTPGGGSSSAKVFSIVYTPNINLSKTDGLVIARGGQVVTYTLVITNSGPDALTNGTVTDNIPMLLSGVYWTCDASVGSSCTANGTANTLLDTVNVAVGGTLTYTISGTLPDVVSGTLTNTASLSMPPLYADSDGLGLSASDSSLLRSGLAQFLPLITR